MSATYASASVVSGSAAVDALNAMSSNPAVAATSTSNSAPPTSDVSKSRAATLRSYTTVTTVLRPPAESTTTPSSSSESKSGWTSASQAYCLYTRNSGSITGISTFGLSNPYTNVLHFAIGAGIEIQLECPTSEARITGSNGVTGASISDSWMFCIVDELAHQVYALGLQIRQLLEKLPVLSVEIAGINLPQKYTDPQTGMFFRSYRLSCLRFPVV